MSTGLAPIGGNRIRVPSSSRHLAAADVDHGDLPAQSLSHERVEVIRIGLALEIRTRIDVPAGAVGAHTRERHVSALLE
jgi:hypothetical protein